MSKPFILNKLGAFITLTETQIFDEMGWQDDRYWRKHETYNVSPTNEDWAKYHRAKSGLLALQAYEGTEGLEEVEIPMPKPETRYRYTETHEEWLARCRTLQAERKAA